jgi:hypothetical protein
MKRFVAINEPQSASPNLKYVKQTTEALTNVSINLELVASQIAQLPVREQHKFFRLLLNYIDITSQKSLHLNATFQDVIILCERLMETANDYYEEQEKLQMVLEGM